MNRIILLLAAMIALLPCATSSAHTDGYTFQELVIPGAVSNAPSGIAANGTISGAYYGLDGQLHGYVLRNGSMQTVDFPGAGQTYVNRVNTSGTFVGYWTSADYHTAGSFVGDAKGNLSPIEFSHKYGYLSGINASGVIAAETYGPENGFRGIPILIRNGHATPLDTPVGVDGAWLDGGINARGAVAGWITDEDYVTVHTFLLDGGRTTWIDYPGALTTLPTGINDHNQVVGVYQSEDYQLHGYVYSSGRYTSVDAAPPAELPDFPGFELVNTSTWPTGINNSGEIVGYFDATYVDWDTLEAVDVQVPFLASPK